MTPEEIKQLIGQPESQQLEYKVVLPPPTTIARIIAAFANTEGGVLILGIQDDSSIQGLAEAVPAPAIVEAAISRITPLPSVRHYYLDVKSGEESKAIYVVEVEKSTALHITEDDICYVRAGNTVRRVSTEDLIAIFTQPKIQCVRSVFQQIIQNGKSITESKLRFLRQYQNLFSIVDEATEMLCSSTSTAPSRKPEGRALARLILSSLVDTFETYLSELLLEIHLAQPKTLKSNSTVTVENVLDCQDMAEYIQFVANRRVQKLKKGDEQGFAESFKSSTGIDVFDLDELSRIGHIFQVRHLYTHSNGRVDAQFLARHRSSGLNLEEEHKMTLEELCETAQLLIHIVGRLDADAVSKFQLSTSDLQEQGRSTLIRPRMSMGKIIP